MKKVILIVLSILLVFMITLAVFWDPIIDALPIDQSGWKIENEVHYYLDEDGDPVTGWLEIAGYPYYFDPENGAMHTGWLELDDVRYCFDADGRMLSGCWIEDDSGTRYLNADGTMATGWLDDGTVRYYLDQDGHPVAGWQEIDAVCYYFTENGTTVSGWQELDDGKYYFNEDGSACTGWLDLEGEKYYLDDETGAMVTGWLDTDKGRYYLDEFGTITTGWVELDESKYYLGEDGLMTTGWLEADGTNYYFREDGSMATGKVVISEDTYYFTSTGANILLVNRWNPVPDDYETELVTISGNWEVASVCYDDLVQMLSDCPYSYEITSAYRSEASQQSIWNNRLATYKANGYSSAAAEKMVADYVAVPGTSEHQLGLAVDISGANAQKWLQEHCWEYGFILRYLDGKSDITGIAYERWHFRYVGIELAMEMKDTGLCLEEYIDRLTGDGTTCGNPDAKTNSETASE